MSAHSARDTLFAFHHALTLILTLSPWFCYSFFFHPNEQDDVAGEDRSYTTCVEMPLYSQSNQQILSSSLSRKHLPHDTDIRTLSFDNDEAFSAAALQHRRNETMVCSV